VGKKRKAQTAIEISLPHLPDAVIAVEYMLGKVSKLKYVDHNVIDTTKFLDFAKEVYLENRGEVGPLGKPILEPTQWITGLYSSGIMNLFDIPHFGHGKNMGLCVKQILARVHGGILQMDIPVPIYVYLINNIVGFPTNSVNPKDYLDNKAKDKKIVEEVKEQFRINRGT
jgi:hypothetical protein